MDVKLILIFSALVILVLCVIVWLLRSRPRDDRMFNAQSSLPHMKSSFDAAQPRISVELAQELLTMLEAGERERVIWIARERAGLDAAQAAAMIEKIEKLRKRLEG